MFQLCNGLYDLQDLGVNSQLAGSCVHLGPNPNRWWHDHCRNVPIYLLRRLLLKFLKSRMTQKFASCVNAPLTDREENTLTIHYRQHKSVPLDCSLASLAQAHGNYTHVLVVSAKKAGND